MPGKGTRRITRSHDENKSLDHFTTVPSAKRQRTANGSRALKNNTNRGQNKTNTTSKCTEKPKLSAKEIDELMGNEMRTVSGSKRLRKLKKAENHASEVSQTAQHSAKTLIPKPKGSPGESEQNGGYNLREAMELDGDNDLYLSIHRTVRNAVVAAGLDPDVCWTQQPKLSVGRVFRACAEAQPYLRRFENDWATDAIACLFLRRRRKYNRKHPERVAPSAAAATSSLSTISKGLKRKSGVLEDDEDGVDGESKGTDGEGTGSEGEDENESESELSEN